MTSPEPEDKYKLREVLVFAPLPSGPEAKSAARWEPVLKQLRARPGEWAIVRTYKSAGGAQSAASAVRHGKTPGTKPGEFEASVRGTDLWLRAVPKGPRAVK